MYYLFLLSERCMNKLNHNQFDTVLLRVDLLICHDNVTLSTQNIISVSVTEWLKALVEGY